VNENRKTVMMNRLLFDRFDHTSNAYECFPNIPVSIRWAGVFGLLRLCGREKCCCRSICSGVDSGHEKSPTPANGEGLDRRRRDIAISGWPSASESRKQYGFPIRRVSHGLV